MRAITTLRLFTTYSFIHIYPSTGAEGMQPRSQAVPTIQFLIACSMQKWRGEVWSILSWNDVSVDRGGGGGVLISTFFALQMLETPALGTKTTRKGLELVFPLGTTPSHPVI